jgi:hypothetical protein
MSMKKITEDQLKEIQNLRESLLEIISNIGELHLNKLVISKQISEILASIEQQETKFAEFQEKERVLYEMLQQEYGTGNINLQTGEIVE